MPIAAAALLLVSVGSGCGKGLVDDEFRGAPLWTLHGEIEHSDSADASFSYQAALFFAPSLDVIDLEQMVELTGSGVPVAVPSTFVLNVFDAPGPEHMVKANDGSSSGYAAGRLLVYRDTNGDRRRQKGEPFVAILPPSAVLYAPTDLPQGAAPTAGPLLAGFHSVLLPQPCAFVPPPATEAGDCETPLGMSCRDDADCGKGVCLRETKMPWPVGYCAVTEPPKNGCRPGKGAFLNAPNYSPTPAFINGYYIRRCSTDADCARPDRDPGLYLCDPGLLACVPHPPPRISVGSRLEVEAFCATGRRLKLPSHP